MGGETIKARKPPARIGVLREAWSGPVAAALPEIGVRTRLEHRLALTPDGAFDHIARIDRTLRKVHLQKLCRWFVAGAFRIEDARQIRDLLLRFEDRKRRLPVEERDLNRFAHPGDLAEALDRIDGIVAADPLGSEEIPPEVITGCRVVASAPSWHVIRLASAGASAYFASGTDWCTRHPGTFAHYALNGPIYVLRYGKRRVQMHLASGQIMDERDRRLDAKAIAAIPTGATWALRKLAFAEIGDNGIDGSRLSVLLLLSGHPPVPLSAHGFPLGDDPSSGFLACWSDHRTFNKKTGKPIEAGGVGYALLLDGVRTPMDWRPDADAIARAFRDRTPSLPVLMDLLCSPAQDPATAPAVQALALRQDGGLHLVAEHIAEFPAESAIGIARRLADSPMPCAGAVLAGMLGIPDFIETLVGGFRSDPSVGPLNSIAELLRFVGGGIGPEWGRLPDETPEALAARVCLSLNPLGFNDEVLTESVAGHAHPAFRQAFGALRSMPTARMIGRRPGRTVAPETVLALLDLPRTGHLAACLAGTPDLGRVVRAALDRGRAGAMAALPPDLATHSTYAACLASPERVDAVAPGLVTAAHVEAAEAAGADAALLSRLKATLYAAVAGPDWLVSATADWQIGRAPPSRMNRTGVMKPDAVALRVEAGLPFDEAVGGAVRSGELRACEALRAVRVVLGKNPELGLADPRLSAQIPTISADKAIRNPALAPYVARRSVDADEAERMVLMLPFEALAGIGSAFCRGDFPWGETLSHFASNRTACPRVMHLLVTSVPLDPTYAGDLRGAAAAMVSCGLARPRRPDGRPWPLASILLILPAMIAEGGISALLPWRRGASPVPPRPMHRKPRPLDLLRLRS